MDRDLNPETPRTAVNVVNVPPGTPFEVELLVSDAPLRGDIAAEIVAGLTNCGVKVDIRQVPAAELYQPGADGLIFGRQFDLALLSWQTEGTPDCIWFTVDEIPAEANYWMGTRTGGANFYGFSNPEFDQACIAGKRAGLDQSAAEAANAKTRTILNDDLPFITIYHHPRALLISDSVCSADSDAKGMDFLRDVELLSAGDPCGTADGE